ncbi:MAG: alpha-glucuronidase family glycosyl hydrolase [Acidobacteriota bacterium]
MNSLSSQHCCFRKTVFTSVWTTVLVVLCWLSGSLSVDAQTRQERGVMGLVELYGYSGIILYGEEDEFAAQILLATLEPHLRRIRAIPAKGEKPKKDDLVIYVGSFESNPLAGKVFKSLNFSLNWSLLTDGSFLLKTFRKSGKTTIFVAGKDRLGTLYGVYDLKNYYLRFDLGKVFLNELSLVERAHLKYRWFRNWDSRTDWDGNVATHLSLQGTAKADVPHHYGSSPEVFLQDIKRTVDFMSEHRLNGLILWGFLRDPHGGIEAAQELAHYARQRGVRLLPGIGVGGHGGLYYEGNHRFNLQTWTAEHPELRAVDEQGQFRDNTLCPEKPANRQWYREGLQWLDETFEIGGLHLEAGDFFVCHCPDCRQARRSMDDVGADYYKDQARIIGFLAQEAKKLNPEWWISFSAYGGFDFDAIVQPPGAPASSSKSPNPYPPEFLGLIPDFAICQWDLSQMFRNRIWPSPFKAPAKQNVGFLSWGSVSSRSEDQLFFRRIEQITHHAISSNLEGLCLAGEVSLDHPNTELGYLAFSEFAFNPAAKLEDFFRYKIARLYGGEDLAAKLSKILELLENEGGMIKDAQSLDDALRLANQGYEAADPASKERWGRLVQYVQALRGATAGGDS